MDPAGQIAVTTVFGTIALMVVALITLLRDLVPVFKAWIEHRWSKTTPPKIDPPPEDGYVETLSPDVIWLNRQVTRLERLLEKKQKEHDRCGHEIEQLRGEVEFLVDQLAETVRERDEALAREARLRRERKST